MNIARYFSYTQTLEKRIEELQAQLEAEKKEFKEAQQAWNIEKQQFIDRLLQRNGVQPINQKPSTLPPPSRTQQPLELPRQAANRKAKELELQTIRSLEEIRIAAKQAKVS